MCVYRLRPHHALCMQFFKGKGYSREFTDNMYNIISHLKADSRVEIAAGADDLCRFCPNLKGNDCIDCEKVNGYDNAVCGVCGFDYGDVITAADFFNAARRKIILAGNMRDICGKCQWSDICFNTEPSVFYGEANNK